jgi:hydroxymethylpyrimidine pyrophosphatase-like HAD family hydrolase
MAEEILKLNSENPYNNLKNRYLNTLLTLQNLRQNLASNDSDQKTKATKHLEERLESQKEMGQPIHIIRKLQEIAEFNPEVKNFLENQNSSTTITISCQELFGRTIPFLGENVVLKKIDGGIVYASYSSDIDGTLTDEKHDIEGNTLTESGKITQIKEESIIGLNQLEEFGLLPVFSSQKTASQIFGLLEQMNYNDRPFIAEGGNALILPKNIDFEIIKNLKRFGLVVKKFSELMDFENNPATQGIKDRYVIILSKIDLIEIQGDLKRIQNEQNLKFASNVTSESEEFLPINLSTGLGFSSNYDVRNPDKKILSEELAKKNLLTQELIDSQDIYKSLQEKGLFDRLDESSKNLDVITLNYSQEELGNSKILAAKGNALCGTICIVHEESNEGLKHTQRTALQQYALTKRLEVLEYPNSTILYDPDATKARSMALQSKIIEISTGGLTSDRPIFTGNGGNDLTAANEAINRGGLAYFNTTVFSPEQIVAQNPEIKTPKENTQSGPKNFNDLTKQIIQDLQN